jgi:hypothetical protein
MFVPQNYLQGEVKSKFNYENAGCHSVQNSGLPKPQEYIPQSYEFIYVLLL